MKQIYLIIVLLIFSFSSINAQDCPASLGNQSSFTLVHFKIDSGTCNDYPNSITIDGSTFSMQSCNGTNLKYSLFSGLPLGSNDTFLVNFSGGPSCQYTNGIYDPGLSNEDISLNEAVSIYPNPVSDNKLNIKIVNHITAKVSLYNVTGKRILSEQISNNDFKSINVSGINNGIYMLQIETDEASVTRKVVIMQ